MGTMTYMPNLKISRLKPVGGGSGRVRFEGFGRGEEGRRGRECTGHNCRWMVEVDELCGRARGGVMLASAELGLIRGCEGFLQR